MSLRLRLRPGNDAAVLALDGAAITPDRLGGLSPRDAAQCHAGAAGGPLLGDLFAIDDDGVTAPGTIDVEGDLRRVTRFGAGMSRGRLRLRGDAGARAGEGMTGGALVIDGSAGDRLGGPAAGGTRGIDGGAIVVRGNAGALAGFRMRRGTIFVGGAAGPAAGAAMLAGTLVLACAPGPDAAALMRRGTVVVLAPFIPGATFAAAGRARAPWLKPWWDGLLAAGVPLPDGLSGARFACHSGDLGEGGRGEILILEGDS